jgi:transcriptional regulator with XRE-family HTH domain
MTQARLIEILDERRKAEGWTDARFCEEVGINRTTWSLARSGHRQISRRTLSALTRRFPEYADQFVFFLVSDVDNSDCKVSSITLSPLVAEPAGV